MQPFRMDRELLKHFIFAAFVLFAATFALLRVDVFQVKSLQISGQNGELPLTYWFPDSSGPLVLDVEWRGFPDQLLQPEDVEASLDSSVLVHLPDVWQPPKPRRHIMTYTLMLKQIPQGVPLALKIPEITNSFRLFLDHREILHGGAPGRDIESSTAYFGDRIVSLGKLPPEARLTLQVSSYGHGRGGVHALPVLSTASYWQGYYRYNILVEGLVILLALLAGFLMAAEYALVPGHKELLWISLFSLTVAGYFGVTGLGGLSVLFPDFPWQVAIRLEYIAIALVIPLYIKWLAALYPAHVMTGITRWTSWPAMVLLAFICLTPSLIFTEQLPLFYGVMAINLLLAGIVMVRLMVSGAPGAKGLSFGGMVSVVAILFHLAHEQGFAVTSGFDLLSLGVLLFLISQIGFLTFFRTQEQLRLLDLNASLTAQKRDLERRCSWRSKEQESYRQIADKRKQSLLRLARYDKLTGLINRTYFLELIERRVIRAPRVCYGVMMIDVDHYKQVVDSFGREYAEQVLLQVSGVVREVCADHYDRVPTRFSGDEFAIWLGHFQEEQANVLAREIKKKVAELRMTISPAEKVQCPCSVSVGICSSSLASGGGRQELYRVLAGAADAVHAFRPRKVSAFQRADER